MSDTILKTPNGSVNVVLELVRLTIRVVPYENQSCTRFFYKCLVVTPATESPP